MKPGDHFAACNRTPADLAAIAHRTYSMARAHCTDPSNPDFVAAMDLQLVLQEALADLDANIVIQETSNGVEAQ